VTYKINPPWELLQPDMAFTSSAGVLNHRHSFLSAWLLGSSRPGPAGFGPGRDQPRACLFADCQSGDQQRHRPRPRTKDPETRHWLGSVTDLEVLGRSSRWWRRRKQRPPARTRCPPFAQRRRSARRAGPPQEPPLLPMRRVGGCLDDWWVWYGTWGI